MTAPRNVLKKEDLLREMFGVEDFPFRGGVLKLRGLTRGEVHAVRAAARGADGDVSEAKMEAHILATGIVEPDLTFEDAVAFQNAAKSDEIDAISVRISELSGMAVGADKSRVPAAGN